MRRWLILLLAGLLASCAAPPPGVTVLRYASPYSPGHPFSRADIAWMDWVAERSGGRLRIEPYWSGALLSSDQSLEELRHGVADIGLITPIYVRGGTQLIKTQSGFASGARTYEQQAALYRCLAARHPRFGEELKGLVVLAVQGGNLPGVLTRDRPVRRLEDLKGLRLRAPTELLAVLDELGADPANMPMGEVYSALAKGVIDGVIAPADTLRALHFAEVTRHFTRLEVPRGAYPARAMSAARWNRLPSDLRAVLAEGTAVWEAALSREIGKATAAGEEEGRASGVRFYDIAPGEQARFDALYNHDAAKNAAALARFGIDGDAVFRDARAILAGQAACTGERGS